MTFEEKLRTYARVLVRVGVNIQSGQVLVVTAEAVHRDFISKVVEEAYDADAKFVAVDLIDRRFERARILHGSERQLGYVPPWVSFRGRAMIRQNAARLAIVGQEDPALYDDLRPQFVQKTELAASKAMRLYRKSAMAFEVQWSVAAAATSGWGKKVFPTERPRAAESLLWERIFAMARVDAEDPIAAWKAHNAKLHARRDMLNAMCIDALHFLGPGTDLLVGLSEKAVFVGGSKATSRGVSFNPNIPTEEVFTAPDWRCVEGTVTTTRPFQVGGVQVKGLTVTFEAGEALDFSAEENEGAVEQLLSTDPGACRLGEIALVGTDSPIFQSGLIFEEILFDENACCHAAFGDAYTPTLAIDHTDAKAQDVHGFNKSHVHRDMMISDEQTDVYAKLRSGKTVTLIRQGVWAV